MLIDNTRIYRLKVSNLKHINRIGLITHDILVEGTASIDQTHLSAVANLHTHTHTRSFVQALVHVSTAFAHCNMRYIKEQFYSSAMTADNAFKLTQCLDENTLNALTPTIIKGYPNTYTYTKVLAEDVVQQHAQKLPVTIFRPGIGKSGNRSKLLRCRPCKVSLALSLSLSPQ